ncbi:hypothetical protein P9112_001976 [Eukaryota sp. TZLM1-RC]
MLMTTNRNTVDRHVEISNQFKLVINMSDIVSDSEIILTLLILLTLCSEARKKENEVTDPVPTSSFNLLFCEQQSISSRTPQSGTVILIYRNKRKVRASISIWNRRSDPSVGVEYCTFSVIM